MASAWGGGHDRIAGRGASGRGAVGDRAPLKRQPRGGRSGSITGATPRRRVRLRRWSCHTGGVPMRQDCRFFESRTYPNGDTVRKCDLDLAPEAPWRCPDDCASYAPRLADVNWKHGTLVTPPTPDEPPGLGEDDSIAALLDAAEDIVNAVVPSVREEV